MREIVVDNFAGGGGTSTGYEMATGRSVDIAINHDPEAIRMHQVNHPDTTHYCESVWDIDPVTVCKGHPVAMAWFSPDCKHFSKAKGNKPKDKNIRGLAWVALRWAAVVRPRVIMLENVEEFQDWGPLNRRHRPIKEKQGETFRRFVQQLRNLGYVVEYRELVAADYGAPTMRKRFFLIARCDGKPITWPEPSHAPADSEEARFGLKEPYVPAWKCLDFSLPCPSIFDTAEEIKEKYGIKAVRPLAENTMKRIARGIQKFILENPEPFILPESAHCIIQYHSETGKGDARGQNLTEPLMTVDSSNRYGLVSAFVSKYFAGGYTGAGSACEEPLHTITTLPRHSICVAHVTQMQGKSIGSDMRKPINTMTGVNHMGEVAAFLVKYYGSGTGQDIKEPLDTITSKDRFGLVKIHGIQYQIVDIGLRMLEPRELYNAQGFPDDYIIDRDASGKAYSRTEQVKRCGNAVPPPFACALVKANLPELCTGKRMPNMRIDDSEEQLRFA